MDKETRFRELIRLQKSSGLTVREFCSNESIAPSTLYYWQKKLMGKTGKKDFIPLIVKPPESSISRRYDRKNSHPDFQASPITDDNVLLELVYPNGTLLRIKNDLDLAHLRALVHLYD